MKINNKNKQFKTKNYKFANEAKGNEKNNNNNGKNAQQNTQNYFKYIKYKFFFYFRNKKATSTINEINILF